jgi:hypothetical protein
MDPGRSITQTQAHYGKVDLCGSCAEAHDRLARTMALIALGLVGAALLVVIGLMVWFLVAVMPPGRF